MEKLESLFALERERNNELYVMRKSYEADMAALNLKMERLPVEIVRHVSPTLQAMVHDARDSAWKEDFREMFREMADEERAQRRKDMREDVGQMFTRAKVIALYAIPFLTAVNIVGQWFNWW